MNDLDIVESYGDTQSITRIFFGFIAAAAVALAAGIVILLASHDYTQALSMAVFFPFLLPAVSPNRSPWRNATRKATIRAEPRRYWSSRTMRWCAA